MRLAEATRRMLSADRAALYCVIWNAQYGRRRCDRRRVSDFDAVAKAESQAAARQWRKEHAAEIGTVSDFIVKHQRGRRDNNADKP